MSLRGWEPAEWMDSQNLIKGDEELMDKRKKKTHLEERAWLLQGRCFEFFFFSHNGHDGEALKLIKDNS